MICLKAALNFIVSIQELTGLCSGLSLVDSAVRFLDQRFAQAVAGFGKGSSHYWYSRNSADLPACIGNTAGTDSDSDRVSKRQLVVTKSTFSSFLEREIADLVGP